MSIDWAYGTAHVKYAYTIELPPGSGMGGGGFILPAKEIIPVGKETLIGLTAMWLSMQDEMDSGKSITYIV